MGVVREGGVEVRGLAGCAGAVLGGALCASMGVSGWGVVADVVRVGGRSHDEVHMRLVVGPRAAGGGGGT